MNPLKNVVAATLAVLMLSGCGGSGGGSNNEHANTQTPSQQTALTQTLVYVSSNLSYRQYAFVNGKVPNTQHYSPLKENEYLLTPTQLYNNDWVDNSIELKGPELLLLSDVPGHQNLITLKKIDVSKQDVYDVMFPGFAEYFKKTADSENYFEGSKAKQLYNKTTLTFPQGAVCYQQIKKMPESAYIRFDQSDEFNQYGTPYVELISNLENGFQNQKGENFPSIYDDAKARGTTIQFYSGTWAGYPWSYYRESDQFGLIEEILFVNVDGIAYKGDMHDFENYELSELVEAKTERLARRMDKTSYAYQVASLDLEFSKKQCTFFNPLALDSIRLLNSYS